MGFGAWPVSAVNVGGFRVVDQAEYLLRAAFNGFEINVPPVRGHGVSFGIDSIAREEDA